MNRSKKMWRLVAALFLLSQTYLGACGINWDVPHCHFDGVDDFGHVLYSEKIGELDLGEGETIPLNIFFRSDWNSVSPYLGQGWTLALLESKIIQKDENTFVLWEPGGWYHTLGRANANDTLLNGQAGWKGSITGDTITVWAECGWKITYEKGKITSITTPHNRQLRFNYSNGVIDHIYDGTRSVLGVETDPQTNQVNGLVTADGKRIKIEQDKRPQVQDIGGQTLVGAMTSSLSGLEMADGSKQSFHYNLDGNHHPTMTVSGKEDRVIAWNPATGFIEKDNGWNYIIIPTGANSNAQIERRNLAAQSEYWFYDGERSTETEQRIDGVRQIKTWFTSGKLAGQIRKIDVIDNGVVKNKYMIYYDEDGKIIKILKDGLIYSRNKDYLTVSNGQEIILKLAVKNNLN